MPRGLTNEEMLRLDREYREVFGHGVPWFFGVPVDDAEEAIALIKEAIEKRDEKVFMRNFSPDIWI